MKNILLIGTGRFGRHIAIQLSQLGASGHGGRYKRGTNQ